MNEEKELVELDIDCKCGHKNNVKFELDVYRTTPTWIIRQCEKCKRIIVDDPY